MGLGLIEILILILGVAFLFGPGALVVWWVMTQSRASDTASANSSEPARDPAAELARERYAKGEINREEFEEIKSTLGL